MSLFHAKFIAPINYEVHIMFGITEIRFWTIFQSKILWKTVKNDRGKIFAKSVIGLHTLHYVKISIRPVSPTFLFLKNFKYKIKSTKDYKKQEIICISMLQKSHKIEVESYQEVYGKISGHGLNPKSHTTNMACNAGLLVQTGIIRFGSYKG